MGGGRLTRGGGSTAESTELENSALPREGRDGLDSPLAAPGGVGAGGRRWIGESPGERLEVGKFLPVVRFEEQFGGEVTPVVMDLELCLCVRDT